MIAPKTRRSRAALLASCLGLEACGAGWHQPPRLAPGPLPPRQQVQVWQHGQAVRWHAFVMAQDSVSGVPFLRSVACDSCRQTLARAEVDSVRLGNPVAGFWKTMGLVILIPGAVLWVACGFQPCVVDD